MNSRWATLNQGTLWVPNAEVVFLLLHLLSPGGWTQQLFSAVQYLDFLGPAYLFFPLHILVNAGMRVHLFYVIHGSLYFLKESDSNSEGSDTEGSDEEEEEEDDKDPDESESDTEGEKSAMKLNKTPSSTKSSSSSLAACSTPLNLQVAKTPSSAPAALCPESPSPVFVGTPSSGLASSTHCGIAFIYYF